MVNFHHRIILLPDVIRKKMKKTIKDQISKQAFDYETKKGKFGFEKGLSKIKWVLLNTHFPFMRLVLLFMGSSFKHEFTYTHFLFIIFLVNSNAND